LAAKDRYSFFLKLLKPSDTALDTDPFRRENSPLLLGHRGAPRYAAENTIEAFELALKHGCDGFEFDVRRTADGVPVVCHGARLQHRVVSRATLDGLLRRSPQLPSLHDVLARFARRCFLYIEIKVTGLEDCVLRLLDANSPERGFVVASFLPEVIEAFRARDSKVPLGFICGKERELPRWLELPVQVVMPRHPLITPELVQQMHAKGKQVITWTLNSERRMRAVAAAGVDGIVSDDTALLHRIFRDQCARETSVHPD
jgi:glycerophosphoryl diester phosphodiesterase